MQLVAIEVEDGKVFTVGMYGRHAYENERAYSYVPGLFSGLLDAAPRIIGVDLAEEGSDESVAVPMPDDSVRYVESMADIYKNDDGFRGGSGGADPMMRAGARRCGKTEMFERLAEQAERLSMPEDAEEWAIRTNAAIQRERIQERLQDLMAALAMADGMEEWINEARSNPLFDVYISGPMTGVDEHNFPAFNAAAKRLREQGLVVFNPAEGFDGNTGLSRATYMWRDFAALLFSRSVYYLQGWKESKGARSENVVAEEIGLGSMLDTGFGAGGDGQPSYGYLCEHRNGFDDLGAARSEYEPTLEGVVQRCKDCGEVSYATREASDASLDGLLKQQGRIERGESAVGAARFNTNKPPLDYIFTWPHAWIALSETCKVGGVKYGRGNYLKSGKPLMQEYVAAILRHAMKLSLGEQYETDDKTGLPIPHDGAIIWNSLCMSQFLRDGTIVDDRLLRPGVPMPSW